MGKVGDGRKGVGVGVGGVSKSGDSLFLVQVFFFLSSLRYSV